MPILHILNHSLPPHSGYTFRTAVILRKQQGLDWQKPLITYIFSVPRQ